MIRFRGSVYYEVEDRIEAIYEMMDKLMRAHDNGLVSDTEYIQHVDDLDAELSELKDEADQYR